METSNIVYRYAVQEDLSSIFKFVDYWLSGKAKDEGVKGGVSDHFVPRGQQIYYLKYYTVLLAMNDDEVLAWAVMTTQGTLIHLLVSGDYRGKGIGKIMLKILNPKSVRSKTDQSSGNPNSFYEAQGFTVHEQSNIGRRKNIDILKKPTQQ